MRSKPPVSSMADNNMLTRNIHERWDRINKGWLHDLRGIRTYRHPEMSANQRITAEGSSTLGIAIRRWRRQSDAADFGQPTAAAMRRRVSVLPSAPLAAPRIGRAQS